MTYFKRNFLLYTFLLFVFTVSSCRDDGNKPPEPTKPEIRELTGKWKLRGIFDVEADTLKKLKPKDGFDPQTGNTFVDCYTLFFDTVEWYPRYNFLYVRVLDEKLKPNPNDSTMSNDEELNKIFKKFGVISYKQSYPKSSNEYLLTFYGIRFKGNIDSLENLLKGIFEYVERMECAPRPFMGTLVLWTFDFNYTMDYTLSTFKFQCMSRGYTADIYDGDFYYNILDDVQEFEFELKENELKLYYNDRKNYLLYDEVK